MNTRRAFLGSVLGASTLLAGCSKPDPAPTHTDSPNKETPAPTPEPTPEPTETPEPKPAEKDSEPTYYVDSFQWGEANCVNLHDVIISTEQRENEMYLFVHSHIGLTEEVSVSGSTLEKVDSGYELDIQTTPASIGDPCQYSVWYEAVVVVPESESSSFNLSVSHNGQGIGDYEQHEATSSHTH
jgi:hypothetical protein